MTRFPTIRILTAAAFVAAALSAAAASADEAVLTQPIQAGSIHEAGVDMVVYYTRAGDLLEVTATYVSEREPAPQRMRMGLADGDAVSFGLPGEAKIAYGFSRDGDTVTISTTPAPFRMADIQE